MDEKILELAEQATLAQAEESIHDVRKRLPVQPDGYDGLCTECGDAVEAPRMKLGMITCIDCAQFLERQRSSHLRSPGASSED